MNKDRSYIFFNGQILASDEVKVSPVNRGMMYGDGCFETLVSYRGKFLRLIDHFARLKAGAKYLGIEVPFDLKAFHSAILKLLDANSLTDTTTVVRVQCWREGERGYSTTSTTACWLISCSEEGMAPAERSPLALSVVSVRALPSQALERSHKLSNGLNYIQAAREAHSKGGDDALMLTLDGNISETSVSNIFWFKDLKVYTPSVSCDLLPGITRFIVMEMIRGMKEVDLIEGDFPLSEIQDAEAVWCTNSVREILPVSSVDDQTFDPEHPFIRSLKAGFELYKTVHLS